MAADDIHECPECGGTCYCDWDDSNSALENDDDCTHDCPPEYDEDDEPHHSDRDYGPSGADGKGY